MIGLLAILLSIFNPVFYQIGEADNGVECSIAQCRWQDLDAYKIIFTNNSDKTWTPEKAGINLGVDCYMESYPEWLDKYFPTLLKCEEGYFYGYFQTPSGKMMGIVSPDSIPYWSLDYNKGYWDYAANSWYMGHRIEGVNLNLDSLKANQTLEWTLAYFPLDPTKNFAQQMYAYSSLPMLDIPQTSFNEGETAVFRAFGRHPRVKAYNPAGRRIRAKKQGNSFSVKLKGPGLYNIVLKDGKYRCHGSISVHLPWEECFDIARSAALRYRQQPSSQVESWYGYHSAFLAAKDYPSAEIDSRLNARFDTLMTVLYNEDGSPKEFEWRIQNTSSTIGILVDRFEAYGDTTDLLRAGQLADWLIGFAQKDDGSYRSGDVDYTSVIYPAKSMLELYLAEKEAGLNEAASRHYESAKKAVDHLVEANGDYETEGELTFEDGMISCSALQIGMFALLQEDEAAKQHYTDALLRLLASHDCLTQLQVPDARRRGGTIRFWEAQYDVLMLPNMISSPHGWSAWRAYATLYAWLLTGDERWKTETLNAMGSFANLIDAQTKELRWAFVPDPKIKARQVSGPQEGYNPDSLALGDFHPDRYLTDSLIVGEQYVNMIGDWCNIHCCENDVHEVFKFIAEALYLL